jgi:hypothetical protein
VADRAPDVIAAFGLEAAVSRWHHNNHIYDRGNAYDAATLRRREARLMREAGLIREEMLRREARLRLEKLTRLRWFKRDDGYPPFPF